MSEAFELTETGDGTLEIHESLDNRDSKSTMVSYVVEPGSSGEEELDQAGDIKLAHTENTGDVDNAAETPKTRKKRPDRELDENWLKIYASRQNRGIIEELVVGIEKHDLYEETIPCLRVNIGNVKGLVPIQEAGVETRDELRRLVGQKLPFIVIGIMEEANLCLLSHKAAVQRLAARTWKEIKEGQVREARVTRVG
ncbi:hypothetical protein, partial [Desulfofundulus sp.]|uniref:hypothetical protein n=1 Tax=Desulfofundulus sp. TaxID=2282750 RepID=UPI003C72B276